MSKRKRLTAKRAQSAAAKRGWATRRANERKRSAAAKRKREANEQELQRIERLLGEDFESLAEARRALAKEKQDESITITTISEWEALSESDFADGEDEEIVANADY